MENKERKKPGPKGPHNRVKRKKDTITLLPDNWAKLDEIGPSRGKAVDKLIKVYEQSNCSSKKNYR